VSVTYLLGFGFGRTVKDGAIALAECAVAGSYPVNIALHTDHCHIEKVDSFLRPLLAYSRDRVARGERAAVAS
jgi:fructose-bisphosphate aldolase class II